MTGHVAVEDATTIMGQHQKHIKHLKTDGREGKEVDGNQLRDAILEEGGPGLRGWFAAPNHVLADRWFRRGRCRVLAVRCECAVHPSGVPPAHPAD